MEVLSSPIHKRIQHTCCWLTLSLSGSRRNHSLLESQQQQGQHDNNNSSTR